MAGRRGSLVEVSTFRMYHERRSTRKGSRTTLWPLLASDPQPVTVRHERGRLAPPLPQDAPFLARLRRALVRLGHGLVLHDALLAAPAMAFHFFLSLLPLLVFVGYVVGLVVRRRGVDAVLSPILDNLPSAAEGLVKGELERLASGGNALGPLAFVTFWWIAAGGIHGLMNAIENVVGTTRRPWLRKRLLALGVVVVAMAGASAAAYTVVKWDSIVHPRPAGPRPSEPPQATAGTATAETPAPAPRRRRPPVVRGAPERALAVLLSGIGVTCVLAGFYRIAVHRAKRAPRRLWRGAIVATLAWFSISGLFALYVKRLAGYATLYGSTAAVAVLLVWLWLTSLAILVGAELNSQLEGLRD